MTVRTTCVCGLVAACAMALPAIAAAQLPNGFQTPGATLKVDAKKVCAAGFVTSAKPVAGWQKTQTLEKYGIRPERFDGELEHLIPVSLGGSNDPENLYPFHEQGEYTLRAKQELADRLLKMVCEGKMPLKQAQDLFRKDWTKAYKQYAGALNAPGGQ